MTAHAPNTRRLLPARALAFVVFCLRFFRALIVSNVQMAAVVLFRPVRELSPDFIQYPIGGLSELEVVLLSHCITLTPGTASVEVSDDRQTLVIHALDAKDVERARASIKQLEGPLLAWTR
jgi:multicomponent Na+:H+ antiporter subunit E